MQVPLQITARRVKRSKALEAHIREKVDYLNRFSDRIISCSVVLEKEQANQQTGDVFNARINVMLPKKELVANHNSGDNLYKALKLAFDDMARQVEEATRRVKGTTKHHPEVMHGEIVRLFKQKQFGFIKSTDGEEYYFNANSVVHPQFVSLKEGLPVHFIESMGDEGLQAHRVSAKEHI